MMMMVTATPRSRWYDEIDDEEEFDMASVSLGRRDSVQRESTSRQKYHTKARHARRPAAKLNNPGGPRRKLRKTSGA